MRKFKFVSCLLLVLFITAMFNGGSGIPVAMADPPSAPSDLTAETSSPTQINVSWSDNSSEETGYILEKKRGGSTTEIPLPVDTTSYTDSGLLESTEYSYRIKAVKDSESSAYCGPVTATTWGAPAAPSNLSLLQKTANQVRITWTDNSSNESKFLIKRKTTGSFDEIGIVNENDTSYTDTSVSPGTAYTYVVFAANSFGEANSNELEVLTPNTAPLEAPSGLSASAGSSSSITLHWTDNAASETGYKVERKAGSGNYTEIKSLSANATSYTDNGLAAATTYYYRVKASRAGEDSNYSNEAHAKTDDNGNLPDDAPYNLKAANLSNTSVKLTWSEISSNETGFKIERKKTSSGSWGLIDTVGANVKTYTDTGLSEKTTYYYRVRAYNSSGYSDYSNTISITTANASEKPDAPSSLKITVNSNSISLTWNDNSDNEDGFKIYRKASDESSYDLVKTVSAGVESWTDTNVDKGTTYYYKVYAYNDSGNSDYITASGSLGSSDIPDAPSSLNLTVLSATSVKLTWTDNSSNESGFKIERKETGGTYSQIDQVGVGVTNYTDTGLSSATTYYYRIRAYNSHGNSSYSTEKSITTTSQSIPTGSKILQFYIGSQAYFANGIPQAMDSAAIIKNGRTLLPIRYVGNALGATVDWNEANQKVTLSLGSKKIELWIGKSQAKVNGVSKLIDPDNSQVTPIIVSGRTMLPIRFISENLGCQVKWNQDLQEVKITY